MTIGSQLDALAAAKASIKTSIEGKGVAVGDAPLSQYASKIDAIVGEGGGGGIISPEPTPWVRPVDWIELPDIEDGARGFNILVGIMPYENFVGFYISGASTVDWGDGETTSSSGSRTYTHYYDFDSLPVNESRVYRQAVIKIRTTSDGAGTFTFGTPLKPNATSDATSLYLEVKGVVAGGPDSPTLTFAANNNSTIPRLLERVHLKSVVPSYLKSIRGFQNAVSLREVILDNVSFSSASYAFYKCSALTRVVSNLKIVPSLSTGVTNMFEGCSSLLQAPDITSSVSYSLASTFNGCTSMVVSPTIDVDKATALSSTFSGCSSLKKVVFTGQTSNVTTFYGAFSNCISMVEYPDFDFSKCTSATYMFSTNSSMLVGPNIETNTAIDMGSIFSNCRSLISAPTINAPNATSANQLFSGCSSLVTTQPTFDLPSALNLSSMFSGCSSLETSPEINAPNATNAGALFLNCTRLNDIRALSLGSANINDMFSGCSSLKSLRSFSAPDTSQVYMLVNNCESLLYADFSNIGTNGNITITTPITGTTPPKSLTVLKTGPKYNGLKVSVNLSGTNIMGRSFLELLEGLGTVNAAMVLTLTNSSVLNESPIVTKTSSKTTAGSNVITVTSNTSLTVGMFATASAITSNTAIPVDASGVFTWVGNNLTNGDIVSFTVRPGTTLPLKTIVYVVNATADTFQVALVPGGEPLTSTAGTCTLQFLNEITDISGTSITMKYPVQTTSTSVSLTFRNIPVQTAVMRGWTVTG